MPRLAATLAGLALVAVPSAIAMANTDAASHSATPQTMYLRQVIRSAPNQAPYGHRHCHHLPGDQQNGTSSGTSGV
jgi:hypothetical protein